MSNETLVKVEQVSKKFCRSLKRSLWYGVRDMTAELVGASRRSDHLRQDEFWAVKDVSFELKRGECLGLIGRNGAGKTTLLKMLNGLIKPDHGRIEMRGRVGALIALGAGFNPILTGRENIYINGSVLGLTRSEIRAKIDDIIEFADLGDLIDSPVQSYSSGMQVRLGFAVATALSPDILLLDEVLAVGDAGFRHKCYSRISKLLQDCAVVFVSHSMDQVAQICHGILRMKQGAGTWHSNILDGIAAYNDDNRSAVDGQIQVRAIYPPVQRADFSIDQSAIQQGGTLDVCLRIWLQLAIRNAIVSFVIRNESESAVVCWHTSQFDAQFDFPTGLSELRFPVGPLYLHPGKYQCSISMTPPSSIEHCIWYWNQAAFVVEGHRRQLGGIPMLAPYAGHTLVPISVDASPAVEIRSDSVAV
jgi:lipopolysaccharide transport system ATP-binding protein